MSFYFFFSCLNANVDVPDKVVKAALANSYKSESKQNSGISLLYAEFNSRVPDTLENDRTRNPSDRDVFDINLGLWYQFRNLELDEKHLEYNNLWVLRSLEGFSVATIKKYSAGYEAQGNVNTELGSALFLTAHGSLTVSRNESSVSETKQEYFITTQKLDIEKNFKKIPPLKSLAAAIGNSAISGKLIDRDLDFPNSLGDGPTKLPYHFSLPEDLCRQQNFPEVTVIWKEGTPGYCLIVRNFDPTVQERRDNASIPTDFNLSLKFNPNAQARHDGDVVFKVDSPGRIENPNGQLAAGPQEDQTKIEITDTAVSGEIYMLIQPRASVAITRGTEPTFAMTGGCDDGIQNSTIQILNPVAVDGPNGLWKLTVKLGIANASNLKKAGGKCSFNTTVRANITVPNGVSRLIQIAAKPYVRTFLPQPVAETPPVSPPEIINLL